MMSVVRGLAKFGQRKGGCVKMVMRRVKKPQYLADGIYGWFLAKVPCIRDVHTERWT